MTNLELAEAMLKGLQSPDVIESVVHYIDSTSNPDFCMACALGSALIGKYDGDFRMAEDLYDNHKKQEEIDQIDILADMLDISPFLAEEVESRHLQGKPIKEIAAWLKGCGAVTD